MAGRDVDVEVRLITSARFSFNSGDEPSAVDADLIQSYGTYGISRAPGLTPPYRAPVWTPAFPNSKTVSIHVDPLPLTLGSTHVDSVAIKAALHVRKQVSTEIFGHHKANLEQIRQLQSELRQFRLDIYGGELLKEYNEYCLATVGTPGTYIRFATYKCKGGWEVESPQTDAYVKAREKIRKLLPDSLHFRQFESDNEAISDRRIETAHASPPVNATQFRKWLKECADRNIINAARVSNLFETVNNMRQHPVGGTSLG